MQTTKLTKEENEMLKKALMVSQFKAQGKTTYQENINALLDAAKELNAYDLPNITEELLVDWYVNDLYPVKKEESQMVEFTFTGVTIEPAAYDLKRLIIDLQTSPLAMRNYMQYAILNEADNGPVHGFVASTINKTFEELIGVELIDLEFDYKGLIEENYDKFVAGDPVDLKLIISEKANIKFKVDISKIDGEFDAYFDVRKIEE